MTLTHDRSNHVLNGTLKSSDVSEASFTVKLLELIAEEFKKHGVETKTIRLADHNIKPGVTSDEGDAWPDILGHNPSLLPAAHPRLR